MIGYDALRNLAFSFNTEILNAYAANAIEIILGGKPCALFDFARMKYGDTTVATMLAQNGINAVTRGVNATKSDLSNIQTSEYHWMIYGALQNLCVAYTEDSKGVISKELCLGNGEVFKMLVQTGAFVDSKGVGSDKISDNKVMTALKRLSIPTQKQYDSKKSRNVLTDILGGVSDSKENTNFVFTGPRIAFGEVDIQQNAALTFTNSTGMVLTDTLFVPLAFLYIIADIFAMSMTGSEIKSSGFLEQTVIENMLPLIRSSLPNGKQLNAVKIFSVNDKKGLTTELARCDKELENWGKRYVNMNYIRGFTLNPNILCMIYDKKKGNKYTPSKFTLAKINAGKGKLGFNIPSMDICFYDTRAERDSTDLIAFNPLNFRGIMRYDNEDIISAQRNIENSEQFPRVVMLRAYLDCIDELFDKPKNGLNKLWERVGVPSEIEIFSEDHYRFLTASAKRYRATELYELTHDEVFGNIVFRDFDSRCMAISKVFGFRNPAKIKKAEINLEGLEGVARRQKIAEVLNSGPCMIEYKSGKRSLTYRLYVTTNRDIIRNIFGDNYIGKYYSLRFRIQYLEEHLKEAKSTQDIYDLLNKLSISDIIGQNIDVGKGKTIKCDDIVYSSDFATLKSSVDNMIVNIKLSIGIDSYDSSNGDSVDLEKKPICTVNLVSPKKSCELDKNGSSTFNVWVTASGVVKLYTLS